MHDKRPILVLTASTGAGHNMAARAVEVALRAAAPAEEIEAHDVLEFASPFFRRLYSGGYQNLVRHWPTAMGWLYDATDRAGHSIHHRIRLTLQNRASPRIVRYLLSRSPKLVVNTHFLPAEVVARLRRAGRLDCPQVTVTTDFETHRLWVHPPTERYYAGTELGKALLATWGVPPDSVQVVGIPVRPAFAQPLEPRTARTQLGLDPERAVVLLLGGAIGYGRPELLFDELLRMPADAQIVAIAGRNERLRRRLEARVRGSPRPVRVLGFTEQIHEWMSAADVLVTKPGGLTSSEALACGLPLVIVNPIPGQETRNSDYLLEHGAAIRVNHPRLLGHRVNELLSDPERLRTLRAAARRLARPDAAARIARGALEVLAGHERLTNPALP
jgi:processive 1,2-diacylglycerol beta-glucosyltransferase